MKKVLFLSLLLFLAAGCKKTGKGFVEGYVYIEGFNTPVKQTKVELWEEDRDEMETLVQSTVTDDEGYFKIKFKKRLSYSYFVSVKTDKTFPGGRGLEFKLSQAFIPLQPVTYIKCTLKNRLQENIIMDVRAYPDIARQTVRTGDSITVRLKSYGYGPNKFSWYRILPSIKDTSELRTETYFLYTPTDTLYRTIEITE